MSKIKVHAGDFLPETGDYSFGSFVLKTENDKWFGERIPNLLYSFLNFGHKPEIQVNE